MAKLCLFSGKDLEEMKIPFSPPDMSEDEIREVKEATVRLDYYRTENKRV